MSPVWLNVKYVYVVKCCPKVIMQQYANVMFTHKPHEGPRQGYTSLWHPMHAGERDQYTVFHSLNFGLLLATGYTQVQVSKR